MGKSNKYKERTYSANTEEAEVDSPEGLTAQANLTSEAPETEEEASLPETETIQEEQPKPEPEKQPEVLQTSSIETEEEARLHVEQHYIVPDDVSLVVVTQDKNVFYGKDAHSATNHAKARNLKIFRLSWH